MRSFAAPHTLVVAFAATCCSLGAFSPWIEAGAEPVEASQGRPAELAIEADEKGVFSVAIADVFADPEAYLGRTLRFTCQIAEQPESWNPYLTRFGRVTYAATRVWGDEQRLWLPEEYEATQGLIFARRASRAWMRLAEMPIYGRAVCEGVVRQVFLNRPWIEITNARALPQALSEGALIHASRGIALMQAGQHPFAANEFERARASNLPLEFEAELLELEEQCRSSEVLLVPQR